MPLSKARALIHTEFLYLGVFEGSRLKEDIEILPLNALLNECHVLALCRAEWAVEIIGSQEWTKAPALPPTPGAEASGILVTSVSSRASPWSISCAIHQPCSRCRATLCACTNVRHVYCAQWMAFQMKWPVSHRGVYTYLSHGSNDTGVRQPWN